MRDPLPGPTIPGPLLEVERLSAGYGPIQAVREVSLTVGEGEAVAIIGANGAGKTSLLLAIIGLLPGAGSVRFEGIPVHGTAPEALVRRGLSLVPERRQVFASMTVHDNLLLGAYHRFGGESRKVIDQDAQGIYDLFPILRPRAGDRAATLSGGMQQMLALGRGLMARPRLLLMDEPLLGLAPLVITEIVRAMRALQSRGQSLLIVEQNARAALGIARRAYVMEGGRIVLHGSAQDLAGDPAIRAAYLGGHVHPQEGDPSP
jgi:branched-chain amino acid transport system ATP-binding protein